MVEGEVIHILGAKNSIIFLFVSNAFMSQYLFNEDGNNLVEVLKGEQLNNVMGKFIPLWSPKIFNFITSFKQYPTNRSYIDNILLLKLGVITTTFSIITFDNKCPMKRCSYSRCMSMVAVAMWIYSSRCNMVVI